MMKGITTWLKENNFSLVKPSTSLFSIKTVNFIKSVPNMGGMYVNLSDDGVQIRFKRNHVHFNDFSEFKKYHEGIIVQSGMNRIRH